MSRLPLALAALVLAGLPACSAGDSEDTDGAQQAADDLAAALSKGEYGDLDAVVAGMGGLPAKVAAGDVSVDGDDATATLTWTWATPGEPWTYDTEVALADGDGRVDRDPDAVGRGAVADRGGVARRHHAAGPPRRHPRCRPTSRWSPDGRWSASASTRPRSRRPGRWPRRARSPSCSTSTPRRTPSWSRRPGPRRSSRRWCSASPTPARSASAELKGIKGAVALGGEVPLAPTREFAAPILGRVGPATAEIVKKSEGAIQPGDEVGLSGLQARYDEQLAGTPGIVVSAVGGKEGSEDRELFSTDEANGEPLRTTLDPRLQTAGRGRAGRGRPGQRGRRDPALDRQHPGRGQRTRARTATTPRRSRSTPRARR